MEMEHFPLRGKCSIFHDVLKKTYISKASKGACVELRVKKEDFMSTESFYASKGTLGGI